ncbi:DNA-invertase hin [Pirellula sp. SH-Sr6A]|uniref:recombinase family protein n=1 Tax=Pirellula sp. SH-Sr6A TaxID=1632865 RepID=UPI00078E2B9C|nr:recombinase family protein [Pirellula sp. SH-Sr6A]AMV32779.1 DNA-invertase hin [Pirellula sp. SH-Sr6A]
MKTAIGYCRVSTEDQASEGVSLEAQRAKIAAWCLANDVELLDIQTDAGLSGGRSDNRPGLQAAIDRACKTKAVLVVYSLSRLARSTRDTIDIGERLDKAGADLVSLSEKIDTTTAAGKMIFRMLAVLAEFERDQVSERTKFALAHKRAKSQRVGAIPYGFDLAPDGETLLPNEREQETIEVIHELRRRGMSLRAIAEALTNDQRTPKKGAPQWTHTTIARIVARTA